MSKRIVVIGGVAGGMSAAARARRLDESAEIVVLEAGGFVSFANCGLPYHIAGRIEDESKLLVTTEKTVRERFRIDTRTGVRATKIDRVRKTVEATDGGRNLEFAYDVVVLATGASAIVPPIAHVGAGNVMTLRSMEDTRRLQAFLSGNKVGRAVIVGGGFIGVEMAEALVDRGVKVTLVEKNPHVLPPLDAEIAALVEGELTAHGVEVVAGTGLASLEGTPERVTAVKVDDGRVFPADLVILSIGVRPSVELAKEAGLEIGPSGGIAVDAMQRTSDPAILAVGDATEVVHGASGRRMRVPLGGPANRQGRVAGTVAATGEAADAGRVMGTAIVQAFGVGAGITGLSEKAAKEAGLRFDTAYVTPAHHASYYPGATPLRVKLVYEVPSGRVLGAQAAGRNGVDKRLDVVATVLHFGGSVHDLARLDLAYAPQFGSAKDPVHMAAFVAQNQLAGVVKGVREVPAGAVLVDVRTPGEFAKGSLPGAINLPLEELRARAGELPRERTVVTYCQVGQRGYVAARLLGQMGFADVRNLKGGYVVAAGVAV